MNKDYRFDVKYHSQEIYEVAQLVAPNFSQITSELSHTETFKKGAKHLFNAITCIFRRITYGISHLAWITDKTIENKLNAEITILHQDLLGMYASERDTEIQDTVEKSLRQAKKAVKFLKEKKESPLAGGILQIEALWKIEEVKENIIAEQAKDNRQERDPTNPGELFPARILAHVLGGFMIGGIKELEGTTPTKTLNYTLEFIDNFLPRAEQYSIPPVKLQIVQKQLSQAKEISLKLDALQDLTHEIGLFQKINSVYKGLIDVSTIEEKKQQWIDQKKLFVDEILQEVKSLKKEDKLLIPGGWVGISGASGHALFYIFEKNSRGKVNLSIVNTGAGISYHDYTFETNQATKKKYSPARQFNDLDFREGEIDEKLISSFLEKQLLSLTYEEPVYNEDDIYGVEVERFKLKEVPNPFALEEMITGQRSGVCAYKSVLIAARLVLGVENYKIFKHYLELDALQKGVENLKAGSYVSDSENHVIHILERASKRMMAATVKLRRAKLLNRVEARQAYESANSVFKAVEEFKQHPFDSSHLVIEPQYLPTSVSQSIYFIQQSIPRYQIHQSEWRHIFPQEAPPESQDPKVFLSQMNQFVKTHIDSKISKQISSFHLLKQINYATHSDFWNAIAVDPSLREQAISVMSKLIRLVITRRFWGNKDTIQTLPIELPLLINVYTVCALLAKHQWAMEPGLKNYGVDSENFRALQEEWGCKELFDPTYVQNLELLKELEEGKRILFSNNSKKRIEFENLDNFTSSLEFGFLETFLRSHSDVANSFPEISSYETLCIHQTPKLGRGIDERILRFKVLKFYTNNANIVFNGGHYSTLSFPEKLKHPSLAIFSVLSQLSDVYANHYSLRNPFPGLKFYTSKVLYIDHEHPPLEDLYQPVLSKGVPKNQLNTKKLINQNLFDKTKYHLNQNDLLLTHALSKSNPQENSLERDLNAIGSDKEIQIAHLLDFFESNPLSLQQPQNQLYFKSRLLEGDLLWEQVHSEPLIGTRLLDLLENCWEGSFKKEQSLEEIYTTLFLCQLSQKIIRYQHTHKKLNPVLSQESDFDQKIKALCTRQREALISQETTNEKIWVRASIEYTLFFTDPFFEQKNPTSEEARNLLLELAKTHKKMVQTRLNTDKLKEANKYYDANIELEVSEKFLEKYSVFKSCLQKNYEPLLQNILDLYNYPVIKKSEWKCAFPLYQASDVEGNTYSINVLTGNVVTNEREYTSLPEAFLNHSDFKKVFKHSHGLEWIPYGSYGFQTTYQGHLIKILPSSSKDLSDFQIIQDREGVSYFQIILDREGASYIYQNSSFIHGLKIPDVYKFDSLAWLTPQPLNSAVLIFDEKMIHHLTTVQRSGILCLPEDTDRNFIELATNSEFQRFGDFCPSRTIAWGNKDKIDQVFYRNLVDEQGNPLSFLPNAKGDLCWSKDPKYFLSADQMLEGLRDNRGHLVLENSKTGDRKFLTFCHISKKMWGYHLIPVSNEGNLKPSTCLQNLIASRLFLEAGNFERALHFLLQAREARGYTPQETTILFEILKNKQTDPWACVIRICAAAQYFDNINFVPPSLKSDSVKKLSKKNSKGIFKGLTRDYRNFVTNRNVPEKYQPSQVLGLDRELRLVEKIINFNPSSNEIRLYFYEKSKIDISRKQGKQIKEEIYSNKKDQIYEADFENIGKGNLEKEEEHLTRPGTAFQRNFLFYYDQACSSDSKERQSLQDRLLFMRFDTTPKTEALAYVLQLVLEAQKDPALALKIPKLASKKEIQEAGNKGDRKIYDNYRKLSPFLHDMDRTIRETSTPVSMLDTFFNYMNPKNKELKPISIKEGFTHLNSVGNYLIPSFDSTDSLVFISDNNAQYVSKEMVSSPPVTLYTEKQLEELATRLKLSSYVYKKIENLNVLVCSENTPTPQYKLKNKKIDEIKIKFEESVLENARRSNQLEKKMLLLANKKTGDPDRDLELDLLRGSNKKEAWTIQKCLMVFLHDRWDLLALQEPPLTDSEIHEIHGLIVEFLISNIHAQQAERGLLLLEELQKVKGDSALEEKIKIDLGALLMHERQYDHNTNPSLLLFEYASKWTVSGPQTQMLEEIFKKDKEGNFQNVVQQLIMGGGKSRVISPIQAQMKADGIHLSLYVVPDFLFETQRKDATATSKDLFGQNVKSLEFTREDNEIEYLQEILTTLQEAITHREYVITRPKDLLCLELEHWESRITNSFEKAELLRKILFLLQDKGRATFDEFDSIFNNKYHVNFTLSEALNPSKDSIEFICEIYRTLFLNPELRKIVRLHQNRQTLITDDQFKQVKKILMEKLTLKLLEEYELPFTLEALQEYCKGTDTIENSKNYLKLRELYAQDLPKLKEGIRKLALLKLEIESLLKETLNKSTNTHYGLSKEYPEMGFSIPYSANNSPNEGSQFADTFETINKTFQLFLSDWSSSAQTDQLVKYMQDKAQNYLDQGLEEESKKVVADFKATTSFDLYPEQGADKELIDKLTLKLNSQIKQDVPDPMVIELILEFISNVPLSQQLKNYTSQLNSNTQDLPEIVGSTQGYSATVSAQNRFPEIMTTLENPETDREITRALIEQKTVIRVAEEEDPGQLLETLLSGKKDKSSFRAFIDIGAIFKGKSNFQVAEQILSYFETRKSDKQAILYWDNQKNIPVILCRQQGTLSKISVKGTSKSDLEETCEKLGFSRDNLFTYYDESHIVGSDVYHDPKSKAFASLSSQTPKDKMYQGFMRMRLFAKGEHSLEVIIQQEEYRKIASKMKESPAMLFIQDVIVHSEMIQSAQELSDNLDATQQMLLKKAKQYMRNKILDPKTPERTRKRLFEMLRPFVEQKQIVDPFLAHGGILVESEISNYLKEYCDSLINSIGKESVIGWNYLQDYRDSLTSSTGRKEIVSLIEKEFGIIIDKQMAKGCLPEKAIKSSSTNMNVQRQVQAEKATESKQEKEVEKNVEQLQISANDIPYREVSWKGYDPFDFDFSISSYKIYDKPRIRLLDHIVESEGLKGIFDSNILVTDNFLKTIEGHATNLFNELQKGVVDVLVIEEKGDLRMMLVSSKEAAYFKTQLAEQKRSGNISETRRLWLVNPEGKIVQQGSSSWADLLSTHTKQVDRLLLQILLLSGNIRRINQKRGDLIQWIEEKGEHAKLRKEKLDLLLEKATARSPAERNKLKKFHLLPHSLK